MLHYHYIIGGDPRQLAERRFLTVFGKIPCESCQIDKIAPKEVRSMNRELKAKGP